MHIYMLVKENFNFGYFVLQVEDNMEGHLVLLCKFFDSTVALNVPRSQSF